MDSESILLQPNIYELSGTSGHLERMPRSRWITIWRQPRQLTDFEGYGPAAQHHPETPKDFYRKKFFEAVDLLTNTIEDRFNQESYKVFERLWSLLLTALSIGAEEDELSEISKIYEGDIDMDRLPCQLDLFKVMLEGYEILCFGDIHERVKGFTSA